MKIFLYQKSFNELCIFMHSTEEGTQRCTWNMEGRKAASCCPYRTRRGTDIVDSRGLQR